MGQLKLTKLTAGERNKVLVHEEITTKYLAIMFICKSFYEVIEAYGGPLKFYSDFYINSVCPLGFTISDGKGKEKNYNYYDSRELTQTMLPFIVESIQKQIAFGIETDMCFCLGTGKPPLGERIAPEFEPKVSRTITNSGLDHKMKTRS